MTENEFRAAMRQIHGGAFRLWGQLIGRLEQVIAIRRPIGDPYSGVQGMLFLQTFKAAQRLTALAEFTLVEDAATVAGGSSKSPCRRCT